MFTSKNALIGLRLMVSLIFIVHSIYRGVIAQTVAGFGEFLSSFGIPLGFYLAWFITLFEFAGGLAMAFNRFTKFIAIGFILHQLLGIALVHLNNGWFVVGGGTGGMEYSLLIIFSLIVILTSSIESQDKVPDKN